MHGKNGPCAWSDGASEKGRIQVECVSARLDRYRRSAHTGNGEPRRYEGMRRNNHLIADPNVDRAKRELKGVKAVTRTDTVFCPAEVRKLSLEGRNFFAENKRV